MDGLECSEINRSELERTLRIDSEFYSKSAIKVSDMLQSRSHDLLTTLVYYANTDQAKFKVSMFYGSEYHTKIRFYIYPYNQKRNAL